MKSKFSFLAKTTALVIAASCFSWAAHAETDTQNTSLNEAAPAYSHGEISRQAKQYSDYDLSVSNLLKMGWTMAEISDLSEDEILKYSDIINYQTAENYICSYSDENNEEHLVSVPKDVFDHVISKNNTEEDKNAKVEISSMSSSGKLNISPIWSSEYYDSYAFDGKMKQTANLTWKGNNTYFSNYRCEWVEEPSVQWREAIYICNNGGLNPSFSTSYFVYKYNRYRNLMSEEVWREWKNNDVIGEGYLEQKTSKNGVGYTFDFSKDIIGSDDFLTETRNHRIYMSNSYTVNPGYNSVVTCAGYYHATSILANTFLTDITSTGGILESNNHIELCNPTLYLNATNY